MRTVGLIALFYGTLFAQNSGLTARQIYLQVDEDAASKTQGKAPDKKGPDRGGAPAKKGGDTTKGTQKEGIPAAEAKRNVAAIAPTAPPVPIVPTAPVAVHLGVRYNLLKINSATKESQEIDPDTNLRTGDCFAFRLKPNRGGYLYVFNLASSGAWRPWLPSAEMADESSVVGAGSETMVPEKYCLRIEDPRGTETFMVVLTEKPEDFRKLSDAIRKSVASGGAQQQPSSGIQPAMVAEYRPEAGRQMKSRDVSPVRIGDEPPNSVYVVNTSETKNDRLVIEIKVRHE